MVKQKKVQKYSEADLIILFNLKRTETPTLLMQEWLEATTSFSDQDLYIFDRIYSRMKENIVGWSEEDLKMKFISFILDLGGLTIDTEKYHSYFDKTIAMTVENHFLKTKTDFMIAKGVLDKPQIPYFHFQEYKKLKSPDEDPVAQLIEAFLIAQGINQNNKPLYGATVTGKLWDFFIMEGKTYCISQSFDCTQKEDLIQIVAILRKFKEILETRLLD